MIISMTYQVFQLLPRDNFLTVNKFISGVEEAAIFPKYRLLNNKIGLNPINQIIVPIHSHNNGHLVFHLLLLYFCPNPNFYTAMAQLLILTAIWIARCISH